MIDWDGEMAQSFSFFEVSPLTWQNVRRLARIGSAELTFDAADDLRASATLASAEDIGECYVRARLDVRQGRESASFVLGTFLAQTASRTRGSASVSYDIDGYSPLLELADDCPPLGYYVGAGRNVLDAVCDIAVEHCRAPVVRAASAAALAEPFVAEPDGTWLDFLAALAAKAERTVEVDPMGRIVLAPVRAPSAMRPVCALGPSGHRIVLPDATDDRDLFGIPTSVQLVWSGADGATLSATAHNDNPDSATSRQSRGRTILDRLTDVDLPDGLSAAEAQARLDQMAREELGRRGCLEHQVSYERGFLPNVGVGSCVYLDMEPLGVQSRAVITSQTISCGTSCRVSETSTFTEVA
ncbi:MAG: hypothetical protein HFJ72_08325 [Adlercreutzia sp.]|nr:hypothetical protein [Adlercreutzia sp.]